MLMGSRHTKCFTSLSQGVPEQLLLFHFHLGLHVERHINFMLKSGVRTNPGKQKIPMYETGLYKVLVVASVVQEQKTASLI